MLDISKLIQIYSFSKKGGWKKIWNSELGKKMVKFLNAIRAEWLRHKLFWTLFFAEIGLKSIKILYLEGPKPIQASIMVPVNIEHHEDDSDESLMPDLKEDYPNEGETQNLIESMEKYMQQIVKKELKAFDDYIEEKLKKYPQHLVDYDEVYQLRQKFYERIRSRMMMMLEQAFKNNNKDI